MALGVIAICIQIIEAIAAFQRIPSNVDIARTIKKAKADEKAYKERERKKTENAPIDLGGLPEEYYEKEEEEMAEMFTFDIVYYDDFERNNG